MWPFLALCGSMESPGTVQVWVDRMVWPSGRPTRILSWMGSTMGTLSSQGVSVRRKWPVQPVSRMDTGLPLTTGEGRDEEGLLLLEDDGGDLGRQVWLVLTGRWFNKLMLCVAVVVARGSHWLVVTRRVFPPSMLFLVASLLWPTLGWRQFALVWPFHSRKPWVQQ